MPTGEVFPAIAYHWFTYWSDILETFMAGTAKASPRWSNLHQQLHHQPLKGSLPFDETQTTVLLMGHSKNGE